MRTTNVHMLTVYEGCICALQRHSWALCALLSDCGYLIQAFVPSAADVQMCSWELQ